MIHMNDHFVSSLRSLVLSFAGGLFVASSVVAQMSPQRDRAAEIPRERVAVSWAIEAAPAAQLQVHRAASRDFQILAAARDLVEGVALPLTAGGAVIRVSPIGEDATPLRVEELSLISPSGGARPLAAVSAALATGDQLAEAGMPMDALSLSVRLAPEIGEGVHRLTAAAALDGRYWISVREANSSVVLSVGADRDAYVEGSRMRLRGRLVGDSGQRLTRAEVDQAEALVVAPDGARYDVTLRIEGGSVLGGLDLPTAAPGSDRGGLWELHVQLEGRGERGQPVLRHAKTAFAVAPRTARFVQRATRAGEVDRLRRDDTFAARLGVRDAGRYEVSGVLYGHDAQGTEQVIAIAHTAEWLEPGAREIELEFDRELIEASGLRAPFVVRHLRLKDQGRLAVLE